MSSVTPPRPHTGPGPARTPATPKEEGLWLLEQLIPDEAVNNVPSVALEAAGRLDPEALHRAVGILVRRHESLRTVFHAQGTTLTREVLPADAPVPAPERASGTREEVQAHLESLVTRPFPLDGSPLLRVGHYTAPEGDVVGVGVHHLIFDGTSMSLFLEELAAAYGAVLDGTAPDDASVEVVPAWTEPAPGPASVAFWHRHLEGFDASSLGLWCDGTEGPEPTLHGGQLVRPFSDAAVEAVQSLQKEVRAPDVVVLLAAYYLLLVAHGADHDLAVGFPVNVRSQAAQRAIGYHVNIVPLRVRYDPAEGFRAFTHRVRGLFFEAIAHADAPVDVLLPDVRRSDASWRTTLFRHIFNYLPFGGQETLSMGGLRTRVTDVSAGHSKFDLEFVILPSRDGSRVKAIYNQDLHDEAGVGALLARYDTLLTAALGEPDRPMGELPWWSPQDHAALGGRSGAAAPPAPAPLEAVLGHVRATPTAPAVTDTDGDTGYAQLWEAARNTAAHLTAAGTGDGGTVAVAVPRGAPLAGAVLGCWLAGAAVLPVAPATTPQDAARAGATALLLPPGTPEDTTGPIPVLAVPAPPAAADGDPGVPLPARSAVAWRAPLAPGAAAPTAPVTHGTAGEAVAGVAAVLGAKASDSVLWLAPEGSDAALRELLLALTGGARLVTAPDTARTDADALAAVVSAHDVRILPATPSTWRALSGALGSALDGRTVLSAGEPLDGPLARRLLAAGARLFSVWGTPASGGWTTAGEVGTDDCADGAAPPAGRPVGSAEVAVVAPDGRALPVGVRGELRVAGEATGTLAHWDADGVLRLRGLSERQLTVEGGHVGLDDVENALAGHPGVRAVAVVATTATALDSDTTGPDGTGTGTGTGTDTGRGTDTGTAAADGPPGLIAVVVPAGATAPDLAAHARTRLPGRARPARYVIADALPLTAWHTVDHAAVAALAAEQDTAEGSETGGDTLLDTCLALFAELLRTTDVAPDTNFFASGGHSLMAAQLAQKLEKETGVRLKLSHIFDNPTPAALAGQLRASGQAPQSPRDSR